MGRACRIVNEPPPTGCSDTALLAAALLLTLLSDYTPLEEDSEESDEERGGNHSQNGNDGRKTGVPGRPQPPATCAPIASIEEIDCFDNDIEQPSGDESPGTQASQRHLLRRQRPQQRGQPHRSSEQPAAPGTGPAAPGGKEKRRSCATTQRLELL
ncbi:uncharacterized protein LOC142573996 [Dermacentor variabilis]|uniref:uncharacterized protein LOC142573996 n=1 Tax=Dermacentor variabilis TaxID=34621 RepID=UPI003F5C001A